MRGLNRDLAWAIACGATLAIGPVHARLMTEKMERSGFAPALRIQVVETYLPSLRYVPWNEIISLRDDPGMADFRRVVREVEVEASQLPDDAESVSVPDVIQRGWNRRLAEAISELRPSLRQVVTDNAGSILLDMVSIPFLGSAVGFVRDAYELAEARRSWLSVFIRLAK